MMQRLQMKATTLLTPSLMLGQLNDAVSRLEVAQTFQVADKSLICPQPPGNTGDAKRRRHYLIVSQPANTSNRF